MFCLKCGSNLPEDANFCPVCGAACYKPTGSSTKTPTTTIGSMPSVTAENKLQYHRGVTVTTPRKPWYKTNFIELTDKQKKLFWSIIAIFIVIFIVIMVLIFTLPNADTNNSTQTNNVTIGQQNALSSAKRYLSIMPFSYEGLIDQLQFEGYTLNEATYAADNCGANWFEQAAKKAAQYLALTSFSKQSLIAQLEFDKFTHEQAIYGAEANGY